MNLSVGGSNPDWDPVGHTLPVKQACLIVTTLEFYHTNLSNAREIEEKWLCARRTAIDIVNLLPVSYSAYCHTSCRLHASGS